MLNYSHLYKSESGAEFFKFIARACSLTKNHFRGLRLLESMKSLKLDITTENHLNPVIEACIRARKMDAAQQALSFRDDENSALETSTCQLMIKGFAING